MKAAILHSSEWNSAAIARHLLRYNYGGRFKINKNGIHIYPHGWKKGDKIIDCKLDLPLFILLSGIIVTPGTLNPDKRKKAKCIENYIYSKDA